MTGLSSLEGASSPLELADMHGDGRAEIISSSSGPWDGVDRIAFYNWSGGQLREVWRVGGIQGNLTYLAAGLLDADSHPDLVAVLSSEPRVQESRILLLLPSAGQKAGRRY